MKLTAGDSDQSGGGKGILSAVMSRITGGEKAEGGKDNGAAGSDGAEAKPADAAETQEGTEKEKKGVPELQASLPPVATR